MALFVPLDVEYAHDEKIIDAGDPLAELVYVRALCFAKKNPHLNGSFSAAQLAVFAHGITSPKKRVEKLVGTGAIVTHHRGWQIAAWLKRNRSGEDIAAASEMASALGIEGNHRRWHEGPEGKPSPKCPLCVGIHRTGKSGTPITPPMGSPESGQIARVRVEEEEEPEVKPEEKKEPAARKPVHSTNSERTPAAAALRILLEHKVATENPRSPDAYRTSVGSRLKDEHRAALAAYLDRRPHATADELAVYVLQVPGLTATQSEPRPDWYYDPTCSEHDTDGLVRIDDTGQGTYGPCPCRSAEPYPTTPTEDTPT